MQTLEEYEREKESQPAPEPHGTGIACPDCGAELTDDIGSGFFLHNPAMKQVTCRACKFSKVVRA